MRPVLIAHLRAYSISPRRRGPFDLMHMPVTALALVSTLSCAPAGQPWFGLTPPSGLGDPHRPVVDVAATTAPPASVPDGEEGYTELAGERILQDLDTITGFSRQDHAAGHPMWGRVTGLPSAEQTAEWVAERFREAGLQDVEVQAYAQEGEMWWPSSWEVRLLADPAFGAGSEDVVLESALPTSGSEIPDGSLTAPLIDAGATSSEQLPEVDLTGSIAVQHLHPASGAYSERRQTVERARQLIEAGAVAVLNVVEQTGNMHVRDFSAGSGPCFNLGTEDGAFLDAVIHRAAETDAATQPRARLQLAAENLTGLSGHNVLGVVPGRDREHYLIVNAHLDGWFDAAGDNGDGLAVLLALARHFAEPDNQPARSLLFVASGGHHSRGLNGPSNLVRMNPELTARAVLAINLEHVAQRLIDSGDWRVEPTEQPMNWGVDNEAPFLFELARTGMERYGFQLNPEFREGVPGDLGGYRSLGIPRVQAIHSGPMYHTSGDVLETISVPGLERAARFYAFYVSETAKASRNQLQPAATAGTN